MSSWGGFTDDELAKLNSISAQGVKMKKPIVNKVQRPKQPVNRNVQEIPSEQKLSQQRKLQVESGKSIKDDDANGHLPTECKLSNTGTGMQSNQQICQDINSTQDKNNTSIENADDAKFLIDESSIVEKGLENLDKFREHQKEVEELNKKKRVMLTNAIFEKEKRANAETKKLAQIKKELGQLDLLVVSDINIIRDKIEDASRHYLYAQKRYESAEKEYIEAKMDLHKKSDVKDQLTEHLYTVIHQNEMRKAAKLHELMNKLEMEDKEEFDEAAVHLENIIPPIPIIDHSLTSMSKICSDGEEQLTVEDKIQAVSKLDESGLPQNGEVVEHEVK